MSGSAGRDHRAAAQRILKRAGEDPAFARRLREAPEDVLAEAGLPREGRDDIMREAPGVQSAERACSFTCLWTCSLTGP
jgi:hypothetical protein